MSNKKPEPLIQRQASNRCPVCGEVSYSRGGVHPQCSVRQADEKRKQQLLRKKAQAKQEKPAATSSRWQKSCPKCRKSVHVRLNVCPCGHTFSAANGKTDSPS